MRWRILLMKRAMMSQNMAKMCIFYDRKGTLRKSLLQKGFLTQNRAQKGKRAIRARLAHVHNSTHTTVYHHFVREITFWLWNEFYSVLSLYSDFVKKNEGHKFLTQLCQSRFVFLCMWESLWWSQGATGSHSCLLIVTDMSKLKFKDIVYPQRTQVCFEGASNLISSRTL